MASEGVENVALTYPAANQKEYQVDDQLLELSGIPRCHIDFYNAANLIAQPASHNGSSLLND